MATNFWNLIFRLCSSYLPSGTTISADKNLFTHLNFGLSILIFIGFDISIVNLFKSRKPKSTLYVVSLLTYAVTLILQVKMLFNTPIKCYRQVVATKSFTAGFQSHQRLFPLLSSPPPLFTDPPHPRRFF